MASNVEELLVVNGGSPSQVAGGNRYCSAACPTVRTVQQRQGKSLSQSANSVTLQQHFIDIHRYNGGSGSSSTGSECSLESLHLEGPPACFTDMLPCGKCVWTNNNGQAITPGETSSRCCCRERRFLRKAGTVSPSSPFGLHSAAARQVRQDSPVAAASGYQADADREAPAREVSPSLARPGSGSFEASAHRRMVTSVSAPAAQSSAIASLPRPSVPVGNAALEVASAGNDDSSARPQPRLPTPRRPHYLPLQQQQPLVLNSPLDQFTSSDHRSEPDANANVPVSARKGKLIRTVSDPQSLEASAFFRPIALASSLQQLPTQSVEMPADDSTLGTALPAIDSSPAADRIARRGRSLDGDGSSCSSRGEPQPIDRNPSPFLLRKGKLTREQLPLSSPAHGRLPSPGQARTPTTLRFRPSVVQHRVWEEEVEEEEEEVRDHVDHAMMPLPGHAEASPLWHSWSGRELSSRLHSSISDIHIACNSAASNTDDDAFLSSTAVANRGALVGADRTPEVTTESDGGRTATATIPPDGTAAGGAENSGHLCFATYKPPLSTTVAARCGIGSTASLRRATLRSSSTSSDRRLHLDSTPLSPTSTLPSSSLRAWQHGSVDCIDQLASRDAESVAMALKPLPTKQRLQQHQWQQLACARGHNTEDTRLGVAPMTTASGSSMRKSAAGIIGGSMAGIIGNILAGVDGGPGGPATEGTLTAALQGRSSWYTSQANGERGHGVGGAMPVPLFDWTSCAVLNSKVLEQNLLLEGMATDAACALTTMTSPGMQTAAAACGDTKSTAATSSEVSCPAPDAIASVSCKFDHLFGWSDHPSPGAAATAASDGTDESAAEVFDRNSVAASSGVTPRSRRPVPRTNPHVFHKNGGVGTGASEDFAAADRNQIAGGRRWNRVLSDSCLALPKAALQPSPTLPAKTSFHSSSSNAAVLLTSVLSGHRSSGETSRGRVLVACLEDSEALAREQLCHTGCSTVCSESALRLTHRLEGETLV